MCIRDRPEGNQFGGQNNRNSYGGNQTQNQYGNGQEGQQKRKPRIFVPMTLKSIAEAAIGPEEKLEVDGEDICDFIAVGRIVQVYKESMRTLVDLCDSTEIQNVIFYQKGEMEEPESLKGVDLVVGSYLKVYGSMRIFKEQRAIVASKCENLVKHDEITNHLLQCFVSSNIRQKGTLSGD